MEQIIPTSSVSQNGCQYRYIENENEKLLLDEAEQSYNRIVDVIHLQDSRVALMKF